MRILAAVGIAVLSLTAGLPVAAQQEDVPSITVTPSGPGGTGYYGAYGSQLPGVYMLGNSDLPTGPSINRGQVPLTGLDVIPNRDTYQQPLPILDAWHGTIGPGIPF